MQNGRTILGYQDDGTAAEVQVQNNNDTGARRRGYLYKKVAMKATKTVYKRLAKKLHSLGAQLTKQR